tara:strand:+ start:9 stop:1571 length:1563 start_codon:yes stop_codon:yes gene_type:complete
MKQTPNELFKQLSKEFTPKKDKELINEEMGQVVTIKPINQIEPSLKEPFWTKFENFLSEGNSLEPIVNTEEKINTKEEEEKIKAESNKVAKSVQNIESHNYDYSPSVENINNVNAQEMLNGIQCEINYNSELTLDEAKEIAVKNLAKDPLHYVKEGQFGVKGLGYTEAKVQVNDGETYGGSGFSEKLKDGSDDMQVVKENKDGDCGCNKKVINEELGAVVTTGNPNSLASLSGQVIRQMMAEKEEVPLPMDEMEDEGTAVSYSDTMEGKGKDHDGDGDIDSDDYLAARDKAIKKAMAKKAKKESIDSKLAEIGKAGELTKMEAQLEFLNNFINEKISRLNSINEDDNLKELVDKKKMRGMQREIKLLEKRKGKMEKMYEKMSGKKFKEMVGEVNESETINEALVPALDKMGEEIYDKFDKAGAFKIKAVTSNPGRLEQYMNPVKKDSSLVAIVGDGTQLDVYTHLDNLQLVQDIIDDFDIKDSRKEAGDKGVYTALPDEKKVVASNGLVQVKLRSGDKVV